jgi:glyoxylase-like metal-dependent hydrolase (beta-lactamase superfamily II)
VDDQFPQMMPKIDRALAALGSKGVDFAVNTHWHFDHAEGNLTLGPRGTWLVSQANSRAMMADSHVVNLVMWQYRQDPYPEAARPVITYDDRMQFHFNGEQIDLLHFGPAHTTGDSAVVFRGRNAVHLGDVFNNSGYPFIDADNGGGISGMIEFCSAVRDELNEDSIVIPGHGPVTDYQALVDYIDMLTAVRDRIVEMISEGASLEAVIAAKPSAEFDARYGDPSMLINRAYTSLSR